MNESNQDHNEVEAILQQHLQQQTLQVDPQPLLDRIRNTLAEIPKAAPYQPQPLRRWKGAMKLTGFIMYGVALFLAGVFFGRPEVPVAANPQQLIQEATSVHHQEIDRCYLVEVQHIPVQQDETNTFTIPTKRTLLWTRGDRFWIECAGPRRAWSWGKDERGTLWIAAGSHEGILLAENEVPRWLVMFGSLCSMRPERLLVDVLRDFDIQEEKKSDVLASRVIRAELKPGHWHPSLRSALLEFDPESKALRRVVLHRMVAEQSFIITYLLIDSRAQNDDAYRLEGHLTGHYEIFTDTYRSEERRRFLKAIFGPHAANNLKPSSKDKS